MNERDDYCGRSKGQTKQGIGVISDNLALDVIYQWHPVHDSSDMNHAVIGGWRGNDIARTLIANASDNDKGHANKGLLVAIPISIMQSDKLQHSKGWAIH